MARKIRVKNLLVILGIVWLCPDSCGSFANGISGRVPKAKPVEIQRPLNANKPLTTHRDLDDANGNDNDNDNDSAPRSSKGGLLPQLGRFVRACLVQVQKILFGRHLLPSSSWRRFRSLVRSKVERYTIYVLECESDKYYVGSTRHKKRRFREHFHQDRQKGSAWTRANQPLRVLKQYRRIPPRYALGLESKITAELMMEYGVNNVRGGMFCSPRNYTLRELEPLTRFLGHYNDLSFVAVREYLKTQLPDSNNATSTTSQYNNNNGDLRTMPQVLGKSKRAKPTDICFQCGQRGHWAVDCPSLQQQQAQHYLATSDSQQTQPPQPQQPTPRWVVPLFQGRFASNDTKTTNQDEETVLTMNGIRFQKIHGFKKSAVDPNDVCFKCGEKGHWAADCPN
jgi:predicted GIY-YIG superfamily endonuclease